MSQKDRVRNYLMMGKTLTRLDGWDKLGVIEVPARISELRSEGYEIETTMISVKNRFNETVRVAQWRMAEPF